MLTEKQLAALLPEVEKLARQAGAAIMAEHHKGPEVQTKADGSPVTSADLASDAIIVPRLEQLTPDIPVVSEEGVEAGRVPDISRGSFWLVDPLDGTKEFIAGTGEFTILIGLVQAGAPVLGVLFGPVADELYSGAVPGTAWSVLKGTRTAIHARPVPESGLLTVTSSFRWPSARLEKFLETLPIGERVRRRSAFKYADVASGVVDVYPAFGTSYEWDSAAGHALVSAAGGSVTLLDSSPLAYGKPEFKNPDLLVVGKR